MWPKNREAQMSPAAPNKPEAVKPEATKAETKPEVAAPLAMANAAANTIETPGAIAPVAAPEPAPRPVAVATPKTAPKPAPNPLPSHVDSRIGSGLKIRGEITGSADMYIDGNVEGKIRIGSGALTIGSNGRVQADVEAREVLVNGTVTGNIKASDRVQLGSTGSVQGGIVTPRIGIDDGARLRGNVETARAGDSAKDADFASTGKSELRAMAAAQSKGE